jgi:hypothetical protein
MSKNRNFWIAKKESAFARVDVILEVKADSAVGQEDRL